MKKSAIYPETKTILETPKTTLEESVSIEEPKKSEEDKSLMKIKKLRKFFGAEASQLLAAQSRMSDEKQKDLKKIQKLTKFFGDSAIPLSATPKKSTAPIEINSPRTALDLTEGENQVFLKALFNV